MGSGHSFGLVNRRLSKTVRALHLCEEQHSDPKLFDGYRMYDESNASG